MDQMTFMEQLFTNPNICITDLNKGLTNQNYLLKMDGEAFVLRVPRFDSTHIVDRHHETLALQALQDADIDVETIYYDEISGYKVTRYIEDAKDFHEYDGDDKLERTALLMKKFHALHKTSGIRFQPQKRYEQYHSHVHHPLYDVRPFEFILDRVHQMQYPYVLCHNDWVEGNILFTKEHTYLIDYEYAADNDPLSDVMSFITENKITDKKERERFYQCYFDEMTEEIEERLNVWETYHNLLWCMWAMMMWEHRKEDIYQQIAKDKYEALNTCTHLSI